MKWVVIGFCCWVGFCALCGILINLCGAYTKFYYFDYVRIARFGRWNKWFKDTYI